MTDGIGHVEQPGVLTMAARCSVVGVALDETIAMSDISLQVRRRVDRMLAELVAIAPPGRRECLQARLERE